MKSKYIWEKPIFLAIIREIEGRIYQRRIQLRGKVLDFGCGDGFFAKEFWRRKVDVGVDVEPGVKRSAMASGSYKKVVIFDGKKLPFKKGIFDTVVSNCVLEHIPNLDENIAEISRVMKRGGKFYTTVMEEHWDKYLWGQQYLGDSYIRFMRKRQVHFNLLSVDEWKRKFGKAGLRVTYNQIYLTKRLCRLIDIFHYLGVPNLVTKKLIGKWVVWPGVRKLVPFERILEWGQKDGRIGGAVYFECVRK